MLPSEFLPEIQRQLLLCLVELDAGYGKQGPFLPAPLWHGPERQVYNPRSPMLTRLLPSLQALSRRLVLRHNDTYPVSRGRHPARQE